MNNRKDVVDDLRKVLKSEPQNKDAIEMMSQIFMDKVKMNLELASAYFSHSLSRAIKSEVVHKSFGFVEESQIGFVAFVG